MRCVKKSSSKLTEWVEQLIETINILPLASELNRYYASIRINLEKVGTPIGGNNLFIAAYLIVGLVMVTANEKEFTRVNGLIVENWLKG